MSDAVQAPLAAAQYGPIIVASIGALATVVTALLRRRRALGDDEVTILRQGESDFRRHVMGLLAALGDELAVVRKALADCERQHQEAKARVAAIEAKGQRR